MTCQEVTRTVAVKKIDEAEGRIVDEIRESSSCLLTCIHPESKAGRMLQGKWTIGRAESIKGLQGSDDLNQQMKIQELR